MRGLLVGIEEIDTCWIWKGGEEIKEKCVHFQMCLQMLFDYVYFNFGGTAVK